jgi:hypothetical protein
MNVSENGEQNQVSRNETNIARPFFTVRPSRGWVPIYYHILVHWQV